MINNLHKPALNESSIDKDPFRQFEEWYGEAYRLLGEDASAMVVGTSLQNQPNSRIVYLRGSDKKGFWFFTNYTSQKGKELQKNKKACLLFFWPRIDRQVRMKGYVEKLSAKESDIYFNNRPKGSQIGAWSSPQSSEITDRNFLEKRVEHFTELYKEKSVPRPPHWGGFRFVPLVFEFWQGRESRLHDRIVFAKQKNGKWKMIRLAP